MPTGGVQSVPSWTHLSMSHYVEAEIRLKVYNLRVFSSYWGIGLHGDVNI